MVCPWSSAAWPSLDEGARGGQRGEVRAGWSLRRKWSQRRQGLGLLSPRPGPSHLGRVSLDRAALLWRQRLVGAGDLASHGGAQGQEDREGSIISVVNIHAQL